MQLHLEVDGNCKRHVLRRTSSLQLPMSKNVTFGGTLASAFSTIKSSTMSIYTSTMSAAGLLDGGMTGSESAINLYSSMARYRCCCGFCRLRVASILIALFSIFYPILVLLCLFVYGGQIDPTHRIFISAPAYGFLGYQLFSSVLMLAGLLIDIHYLLIPFQLSLVLNVMGSMGMGVILMVSVDKNNTRLLPSIAVASMVSVALHLWFLVITCMTFVLIRDKSRLSDSELDIFRSSNGNLRTMERVNSAQF